MKIYRIRNRNTDKYKNRKGYFTKNGVAWTSTSAFKLHLNLCVVGTPETIFEKYIKAYPDHLIEVYDLNMADEVYCKEMYENKP